MQTLGKLLIVIAIIACSFKIAVSRGLDEFDLSWFAQLDQFGTDTGWILRFLMAAIGLALVLFGEWGKAKGL